MSLIRKVKRRKNSVICLSIKNEILFSPCIWVKEKKSTKHENPYLRFLCLSSENLQISDIFKQGTSMYHKEHKAVVQFGILQGYVCPYYIALHFEGFKLPGGPQLSPKFVCSLVCSLFPCSASQVSWPLQVVFVCQLLINWVQPIGRQRWWEIEDTPPSLWFHFPLVTLGSGCTITLWHSSLRMLMASCSR